MAPPKNLESEIHDFALAIGLLVRKIRSDAPSEVHDLSWTQRATLTRLEKDGPATIADLARAEGVKPQSMGTAVAGLEGLGFVERKPHPTDGRQVHILLSAKGTAMRKGMRDAKMGWLSEAFAKLDKQEQATLLKAGELIKRLVEA
jgi:DNA-binding MarR family transcriptional regulator